MKIKSRTIVIIFVILSLVSIACLASISTNTSTQTQTPEIQATDIDPTPTPEPQVIEVSFTQEELLTSLYQRVNPGVVSIRVLSDESGGSSSLGSGFVIDSDGHIITNFHVVRSASELEIDFPSGYKTRGEILGTDADSDIAVLKVDAPAEELVPIPLGDSDSLLVGQIVVAIGNPHGLSGTLTSGVISSLGRTLPSLHEAPGGNSYYTAGGIIQTDAAINPGNSGGPLLNLDGEIIGVNVAIQSSTFDETGQPVNSGIGFTIPINIVKRVVPHLIADGHYDYSFIGIGSPPGGDLSLFQQEALGLSQSTGVYIIDVSPNSPASRAGLRGGTQESGIPFLPAGGDLIIGIDGNEVRDFNDLISYLILHTSPGDTVSFTILRNNEQVEIDVTLAERP
ncbi:MAG: trypsin-like peptidase domain-containing protein [Anaerolineales bacterium]|nr:trypsin-like peptidase domain-containing protein [Chloroflexota bacterium]MBL6981768.1 trypsin-like peptidase domain-containing protein [Anaerolineales bacterium]